MYGRLDFWVGAMCNSDGNDESIFTYFTPEKPSDPLNFALTLDSGPPEAKYPTRSEPTSQDTFTMVITGQSCNRTPCCQPGGGHIYKMC